MRNCIWQEEQPVNYIAVVCVFHQGAPPQAAACGGVLRRNTCERNHHNVTSVHPADTCNDRLAMGWGLYYTGEQAGVDDEIEDSYWEQGQQAGCGAGRDYPGRDTEGAPGV